MSRAHAFEGSSPRAPVLVTGGAGFIGSNLAHRLASEGEHVLVLDALVRPGVERNLAWLKANHPRRISVLEADVRDADALLAATADAAAVFHLAAQVAVTTSLADPLSDFAVNAAGTLALLETLRRTRPATPLIFASTNKVYGDLSALELDDASGRYLPCDRDARAHGIAEDQKLDFHTPYGCSKGTADQYVLDYARSFSLPAAVLRMSCIYGPRQMGTEDQGWVAHFLLRMLAGEEITLYGDGRQVRDVLFVDDAVEAYVQAWRRMPQIAGRAFNLGGGADNAVSLLDVIASGEEITGRPAKIAYEPWRAGDQRYFVCDSRAVRAALDLPAPLAWREGIGRLASWLGSRLDTAHDGTSVERMEA